MAALTGLVRRAGPITFFMASGLPTQTTEQRSVLVARSLGQQMEDRTGLAKRVGLRALSIVSRLPMQTMEQPLVTTEPSSEQQMRETRGLTRQAERPTRF